jgi:[ribosomal protein S5]-alanine N-acetyltransferase
MDPIINGIKHLPDLELPDLGFAFLKPHWGNGYAYETSMAILNYFFSQKKLTNVLALVHPNNTRSQNLVKKMGFSFLKSSTRNGFPTDIYELFSP